MNLFAIIYERETRAVLLYTFLFTRHSTHNCRDAEHRQMQVTRPVQYIARGVGVLFSIVAGMCV